MSSGKFDEFQIVRDVGTVVEFAPTEENPPPVPAKLFKRRSDETVTQKFGSLTRSYGNKNGKEVETKSTSRNYNNNIQLLSSSTEKSGTDYSKEIVSSSTDER